MVCSRILRRGALKTSADPSIAAKPRSSAMGQQRPLPFGDDGATGTVETIH
jgi:hypothetical protein